MGVQAAVKTFRDTSKESAFKEIEMTFSLRHPNIVGMYAWFIRDRSGEELQIGWVAWREGVRGGRDGIWDKILVHG